MNLADVATSNRKIVETTAIFPVISDILIVNTHLSPPLPPYQCCYGFSNHIQSNKQQHRKGEGGGGSEMYFSFPFVLKSAFFDGNPVF